ncbi:MAG: tRNA (adenosine(37)-N6)-threonylcarbamoyltransferase complex transferase subunit TsaD [Candidatus Omnitrophica bacterium]|nr:tRNA (adenosine(37)-N6)-threonylcarbamoyltransferase complex transferase subunit TsaD [Candidatus Omnitrophota bacterium]MDD5553142.1 tRNA (adenosine(37)-N6)-threonylcarbamoyltransferase complex transferase subunit TsaD [Candidatus Omnitrophota bacterium]
MYVLGIETSCDETAASIVKDGKNILSSVVSSSLEEHAPYGGVIPEIASRMHLESITRVVDSAIRQAKIKLKDVGLVSVTAGPGLAGSLLVGVSFAKALSLGINAPLLGVDHLSSHIYANFLSGSRPALPFVALIVSGGHTVLFYVKDLDKIDVLGSTHDDACGEAFDKVAKILKLGYPGGPVIERLAKRGDPEKLKFKCSNTDRPLDFSFSGIKTAVMYFAKKNSSRLRSPGSKLTRDIAASFQEAAIDTLIRKSFLACKMKKAGRLVIGGGVAANGRMREKFFAQAGDKGIDVYFPERKLCMDNAAMVAGLGYQLFRKGRESGLGLNIGG